jgi:hypothetical protein
MAYKSFVSPVSLVGLHMAPDSLKREERMTDLICSW